MADSNALQELRHSAAHLLAHAITELYPDTLLTIGPATEEGFFYDVKRTPTFKEEDLPGIHARMMEIADRNLPITHELMHKDEARTLFAHNKYKLELIEQIPGDYVGIARQGNFFDLCKGGHVASTGLLKHTALLYLAGSYWRADRTGDTLQRIAGTAFFTKAELDTYLKKRADAIEFDHRKLGTALDLFSFNDYAPGFPFYHPHGRTLFNTLVGYMRSVITKHGFKEVATPTIMRQELWEQSGHYGHYKDNMYFCKIEDESFAIKPMNCPGAILLYKERPHSYRELPLRFAEFSQLYRFELSGVLHGMFRTRAFSQDDAHIFCEPASIQDEVRNAIILNQQVMKQCGFEDISIKLATRPPSSMGTDEQWNQATAALQNALEQAGVLFEVKEGDGAFYGPKIEFHIKDSMGRSWQCGTIQVDFSQPENFDLHYITNAGIKARPVMIHRAIFGSFERFIGVLLEHYKGKLPLWLSPVQVRVLTITDEQHAYAQSIADQLQSQHIRVAYEPDSDAISAKIKRAQLMQVPLMIVVGKKELEQQTVTIRHRDGAQQFGAQLDDVIALVRDATPHI